MVPANGVVLVIVFLLLLSAIVFCFIMAVKTSKWRKQGKQNRKVAQSKMMLKSTAPRHSTVNKNSFERQIQLDIQKAHEHEKSSPNPKFHRTEHEEELSFKFSCNHSSEINLYESELYDAVKEVGGVRKSMTMLQMRETLKQCDRAIKAFQRLKTFCKRSKGGQIYFQDMWEYLHNSNSRCFSYIDQTLEIKRELEERMRRL